MQWFTRIGRTRRSKCSSSGSCAKLGTAVTLSKAISEKRIKPEDIALPEISEGTYHTETECPTHWLVDVSLIRVAVFASHKCDAISILRRRGAGVETLCQTPGGTANVVNRFPIRQLAQKGQRRLGWGTHDSQRGNGRGAVIGTGMEEAFRARLKEFW